MIWPFSKKPEPAEEAYVEFGSTHYRVEVLRDADRRPYAIICGRPVRLDIESYREIVWIKRSPDAVSGNEE